MSGHPGHPLDPPLTYSNLLSSPRPPGRDLVIGRDNSRRISLYGVFEAQRRTRRRTWWVLCRLSVLFSRCLRMTLWEPELSPRRCRVHYCPTVCLSHSVTTQTEVWREQEDDGKPIAEAMHLRQRGHDFVLPNIKYDFIKRHFIARSLFITSKFLRLCLMCTCNRVCIVWTVFLFIDNVERLLFLCKHVRLSRVFCNKLTFYTSTRARTHRQTDNPKT